MWSWNPVGDVTVLTPVFKTVVWTKRRNECWLFSGSSRGEERDEGDVGCRQRVHQSRNCKLAELTGHRAPPVSALYTPTHRLEGRCICHMSDDTNLILHFILEDHFDLAREHWMPELKSDSEEALNNAKLHEMDGHDKSFYIKILKREPFVRVAVGILS